MPCWLATNPEIKKDTTREPNRAAARRWILPPPADPADDADRIDLGAMPLRQITPAVLRRRSEAGG